MTLKDPRFGSLRIVRIYACDDASERLPTLEEPTLAVSPILLHNMGDPERVAYQVLHIHAPANAPWKTARAVTIARIASEHSMHKDHQAALIAALKSYFQAKRRVLGLGDLIAIPIDDTLARFAGTGTEHPSEESIEENIYEWAAMPNVQTKADTRVQTASRYFTPNGYCVLSSVAPGGPTWR